MLGRLVAESADDGADESAFVASATSEVVPARTFSHSRYYVVWDCQNIESAHFVNDFLEKNRKTFWPAFA